MADGIELGKAYVQIVPSAKGIKDSIVEELGGESARAGESAGQLFTGKLVGTIKTVLGTAAIGKMISDSVNAGGALQQSLGGIETLFKDSADKVKTYAAQAYKTAGLSANDYMESTTSFAASLLSSVSQDTDAAAQLANMAMVDMSDNANKMGTSMQDIQNAYQGFAKQNYTMLDNLKLGYGGTQAEMQRLLKDAEKISGVHYDLGNLADMYSAIHIIQTELDITGTTAREATTTLTGSFASMKAAAQNVLGQMRWVRTFSPRWRPLLRRPAPIWWTTSSRWSSMRSAASRRPSLRWPRPSFRPAPSCCRISHPGLPQASRIFCRRRCPPSSPSPKSCGRISVILSRQASTSSSALQTGWWRACRSSSPTFPILSSISRASSTTMHRKF